jgi:GAF domain-containing protein
VFATGDIGIWWWDAERRQGHASYVFEHGVRQHHAPYTVKPGEVWERLFDGRETLLVHNRAESMALGMHALEGTDQSLSALCMPIVGGDRVLGSVVLEDYERENAFGPDAVRLLGTVVASMGVALENARLFDETQRLLKETERRERESSALSEVGRDLSSTLDLATVMDRIASHAKDLLGAADSAIFLPAVDGQTYRAIVAQGPSAEALRATAIVRGEGIIGRLIDSGQPELINDTHADPRAVQVAGTTTQDGERMMVVPLLSGEDVKGAMVVWRAGGAPFDSQDLDFLVGLSRHAAVALHNAKLFDETRQALERQTAAAEVLQVISGSMADPKPVFEKILDSCTRLFGAGDPAVCLVDGDLLRIGSYRGQFAQEVEQAFPRPLAGTLSDMAIRRGSVLYLPSVLAADGLPSYIVDVARKRGDYSVVNAPMTWDGRGIGTIDIICMPPRVFSEADLGLVKTFADQAVIAIQNARLFNETQEALAHQTASADILRVISSSPTDVQPVFDAIVTTAIKRLGCDVAIVQICSGDTYSPKALATPAGLMPVPGSTVLPIDPEANFPSRAIASKAMLHLQDWSTIELPAHERARHEQLGLNSALYLPLLRGDACVGVLVLGTKRAHGFNDKAVALAESFRDQAVIAIENVRLFNETREALERQTATAEILKVISSSPTDTQPVFDAILRSAARLFGRKACPGDRRAEGLRRGPGATTSARRRSTSRGPLPAPRQSRRPRGASNAGSDRSPIPGHPMRRPMRARTPSPRLSRRGLRADVHDGRGIGVISVSSPEPGACSDSQMAMLQTFADQAVIAIQNARLFNETQGGAGAQTATAEILTWTRDQRVARPTCSRCSRTRARARRPADLRRRGDALPADAARRRVHRACWSSAAASVGAFSAKEIALARIFADQAVIAIENVRLFNETKEALERQTATAEILKVISGSPTVRSRCSTPSSPACCDCSARSSQPSSWCAMAASRCLRSAARRASKSSPRSSHGRWTTRTSGAWSCCRGRRGSSGRSTIRRLRRRRGASRGSSASTPCSSRRWSATARSSAPSARRAPTPGASTTRRSRSSSLRRPGGDRDRERAPVQRDEGGAGAADGHRRGAAGDQRIADRCPAGVRRDCGAGTRLNGRVRLGVPFRRQAGARGELLWPQYGRPRGRCAGAFPMPPDNAPPPRVRSRRAMVNVGDVLVEADAEYKVKTIARRPATGASSPCRCGATARSSARWSS